MSTISLCGNPKCCPVVKENEAEGTIAIVEGDQVITFTKGQMRKLTEYLVGRKQTDGW